MTWKPFSHTGVMKVSLEKKVSATTVLEIISKEEAAKLQQEQTDRKEYSEGWQPPKIEVPAAPIHQTEKPVTISIREEMQKLREREETVPVSASFDNIRNLRSSQTQSIKEILGSADNRLIISGIGNHIKSEAVEPMKEEEAIAQPAQPSRRFKL